MENKLFEFIAEYMPLLAEEKQAIMDLAIFRNYKKGTVLLKVRRPFKGQLLCHQRMSEKLLCDWRRGENHRLLYRIRVFFPVVRHQQQTAGALCVVCGGFHCHGCQSGYGERDIREIPPVRDAVPHSVRRTARQQPSFV